MGVGQSFLIVDDDPVIVAQVATLLRDRGHDVRAAADGSEALLRVDESRPDCILLDIMLPGGNGIDLCREMRSRSDLGGTRIVMMSSESHAGNQCQARDAGADGFIAKPINHHKFLDQVEHIVGDSLTLTHWGVRGTLPVPGPHALRYGGNTPCCTVEVSDGPIFVFDAGSGIKSLSDHLGRRTEANELDVKILISHPHWDHINALPFFAPLYVPGNRIEILGARNSDLGIRDLISSQMDGVFFPITMHAFGAQVAFRDITEETLQFGDVTIRTMLLNHPGACLGYRLDYRGYSICYVTDNELYPQESGFFNAGYRDKLAHFVSNADVLVTDSTYLDDDYPAHIHWGHSAVGQVVDLAHLAGVKMLHLFHHDPDQDDEAIDRKLAFAQRRLDHLGSSTQVEAPAEHSRWAF